MPGREPPEKWRYPWANAEPTLVSTERWDASNFGTGCIRLQVKIMLANVDEHHVLAYDPHFVNYILLATGLEQVYSIRDIGLKIRIIVCESSPRAHDVTLAANCDLVRFLHHATLNEDPPIMLQDLLRTNGEDFNENLLGILSPALSDPFNTLLAKLCDDPNKIPQCDLRDLEIALVLSNDAGRKKLLFDYLDYPIHHGATARCHCPLAPMTRWVRERVWESLECISSPQL